MNRSAACIAFILMLCAAALALRLPQLDARLVHGDEAVHAVKCDELWRTGRYRYDPDEYHGPTLYYLTQPVLWLSGATDFTTTTPSIYRIVPVLIGAATILLLLLVRDGLGQVGTIAAAALTAASPAMVFYSRYYIQETLLVFFTFLLIAAGWRYVRSRHLGWALLAGTAAGLMHATKETCLIALASLGAALLLTILWSRHAARPSVTSHRGRHLRAAGLALLAASLVSSALYSGFLTNAAGPLDSLSAYATYFGRAGGGIHDHPWYYYLQMLLYTHHAPGPAWSEALLLILAGVGIVVTLLGKTGLPHPALAYCLALYTLLMVLIYSAIPYKTPWCALGFLHAMILLASVGVVFLVRSSRGMPARLAIGAVLTLATVHLGWQAWRGSQAFCNDVRNPYVYAHPVRDVADLGSFLESLATAHPDGHHMMIRVIVPNYWPLPWYLRRFDRVGYYDTMPPDPNADVVLASSTFQPQLTQRLHGDYHVAYHGLRRNEVLVTHVRRGLWDAFVQQQRADPIPATPAVYP